MTQGKENEKSSVTKPDLYAYPDYRAFLRDWFAHLKGAESGFSLRDLARTAGLASGYLPSILSGRIGLTAKALQKLAPHLRLSGSELSYLELLRTVAEADQHSTRVRALAKIQKHQEFRRSNPREFEVFQYLSVWLRVAIREMAAVRGFRLEAEWIRKQFKHSVTLQQVRDALEFLLDHGFLVRSKGGKVSFPEKTLNCMDIVYRTALRQFHRDMLHLGGEALDNTPIDQRFVVGHTVGISAGTYPRIQGILEKTLQEIADITRTEKNSEAVYHVALAAFPLTQGGDHDS
jgi:uncharacterized protein (TIGR02147 family)